MNFILLIVLISCIKANKVWLITDTHFDDKYHEGGYAKCKTIDCCHENSKPISGKENEVAGKCGHYSCYPPLSTFSSGLDYIYEHRQESQTIIWLMDAVPGDVITQSKRINKERIQTMTDEIKKKLPGFKVIPINGNHDYYPSSNWQFPPQSQWMLEFIGDTWKGWLSDDAINSYKVNGYYSTYLEEGIRVIALNLGPVDVFSIHSGEYTSNDTMLTFIRDNLEDAKKKNEKVLIVAHECVGLKDRGSADLNPNFNKDFIDVVTPYKDIVLSEFCGHAHYDSFRIMPSVKDPQFYNLIFPAMTTWKNIDMKFSLIEYDRNDIKNFDVYYLNLTECNANGKYEWKKEHNTEETFGLKKINTETMVEFYNSLFVDDKKWADFMKYYSTEDKKSCTGSCRKKILCSMGYSTESDYINCINN